MSINCHNLDQGSCYRRQRFYIFIAYRWLALSCTHYTIYEKCAVIQTYKDNSLILCKTNRLSTYMLHIQLLAYNRVPKYQYCKIIRSQQDSNLRSHRESDFESDALTTPPQLRCWKKIGLIKNRLRYHRDTIVLISTIHLKWFLDSLVVRISACHVEGPGSIPGRGEHFLCQWDGSGDSSERVERVCSKKTLAIRGIEPVTFALLARRSNQLS